MNLLNNTRKIFITETAWLALVDKTDTSHTKLAHVFKDILDQQFKIITSSYVIDSVLEMLKQRGLKQEATIFLSIIDAALMANHIKVFWLNRRLRKKAIDLFLNEDFEKMNRALNIELIKQKRVHSILTLNSLIYEKYKLPCITID